MNTTLLSHQDNDEISSIMNQNFASKFKADADSIYYQNKPKFNIIDNTPKEEKLNYLFPSFPKEKIEQIFQNNKDTDLDKGIELITKMKISDNIKNEININNNNNKYSYSNKYKLKRNYYTLLNQTPSRMQKATSNIINTNYNININNIRNNKIEEVNSRNNINEKRNIENTKGEERNKLELKTVDQIAEELLNSKDQEELKKYLFIQLLFLNEKYKKDKIFQKIKEQINLLDIDYLSLDKCQKTIPRPINKNKFKISELDNKNSELNEEIKKKKESIKYLEYIGNVYFNISKIKKLDLN